MEGSSVSSSDRKAPPDTMCSLAHLADVALPLEHALRSAIAGKSKENEACDTRRRICSLSYIRKCSIVRLHVFYQIM